MSLLHSNFCFNSPLPFKPRKHNNNNLLSFSSFFLSPPMSRTFRNLPFIASSLENPLQPVSLDQITPPLSSPLISATDVVRNFYGGINRHELAVVEPLISESCVYEDLIFPQPFVGRKSILEFFGKFIDYVSTDLQFVIDAISEEDSSAVGVTWHLVNESWHKQSGTAGLVWPFSTVVTNFFDEGVLTVGYARDSVEPAIKPGESALTAIRGVTWLLQRFPKLAERF
uniref:SnoaL-like domain-containing protein n=1 Tax=Chenopodium quinoa TaxID=63459 RepID=A0A803M2G1_CHEQI